MLVDTLGRKITYLRISVTDKCNFRCLYCIGKKKIKWMPHEEILRFEEIEEIVKTAVSLGIIHVRLTGGEPLLKKDIEVLVEKLASISPELDLAMTTNGYFLEEKASLLKSAGLKRLNISLDSVNPEKYKKITGVDALYKVLKGIEKALETDFDSVKINTVIMKGINEDEVLEIAELSLKYPVEVRFIEFMPVGKGGWDLKKFVSFKEIKKILEKEGELKRRNKDKGVGPSQDYLWRGKGKIGFIPFVSSHFCKNCNRFRITPDGKLRVCLFSDTEINLKPALREGKGTLEELFCKALRLKPAHAPQKETLKKMHQIGG